MSLEILTRSECEKCQGFGVVQHPAWAQFWKEHPEYPKRNPDGSLIGVPEPIIHGWFYPGYGEDRPPEVTACSSCGGTCWQQKWVALETLLSPSAKEQA